MKNFKQLRQTAGLGDNDEFCRVTGLSQRTLWSLDNNRSEPAPILLRHLRLLANGCQWCTMATRAESEHPCEKEKNNGITADN